MILDILFPLVFALACIGLPAVGVVATHLFYYFTNQFPWQLRIQLLETELTQERQKQSDAEKELTQIREKLLDALSQDRK